METEHATEPALGSSLQLGKLRRLAALADHDGRFQVLSAEARGPLAGDLAPSATAACAQVLSTQATAVVLDPVHGLPHGAMGLDRGAALVVALGAEDGRAALLDGWSVAKSVRLGAAGVVLRIAWPVTSVLDSAAPELVQMVGDECAKHELPLLLELNCPASADDPAALAAQPDHVVEAVNRFATDEYQVDLLAVDLPARLTYVEEYAAGALDGVRREPVLALDRVTEALDAISRQAAAPWLVTGSDSGVEELLAGIRLAAARGASGFLWPGGAGFPAELDRSALDGWLVGQGVYHFRRAVATAERALPWYNHRRYLDMPLAEHEVGWYRAY